MIKTIEEVDEMFHLYCSGAVGTSQRYWQWEIFLKDREPPKKDPPWVRSLTKPSTSLYFPAYIMIKAANEILEKNGKEH